MNVNVQYDGWRYASTISFSTTIAIKRKNLPLDMKSIIVSLRMTHDVPVNIATEKMVSALGIADVMSLISNVILIDGTAHDEISKFEPVENEFRMMLVDNAYDMCTLTKLLFNRLRTGLTDSDPTYNFILESVEIS